MRALRRFFSVYQNWLGVLILLDFGIAALLAPSLPPPIQQSKLLPLPLQVIKDAKGRVPQPPSIDHPLGTLERYEDILVDLVLGARQAFGFSLQAGLISALIGIILGASSAYAGGFFNSAVIRFSDIVLSIPVIVAAVMIAQLQRVAFTQLSQEQLSYVLTPQGVPLYSQALQRILNFDPVLWAIIFVGWIPYTRMINAMVIMLKNTDFIQASRAMGASSWRVIFHHLIPNAITPALVLLARDMGWVVILQASLDFAGFAGNSVWGGVLIRSRNWIIGVGGNPFGFWWVWIPATLALVVYGIAWNLVGDGLNDALNPHR